MEHRWGSRVELAAIATLRTDDGQESEVRVRNASLSGAYLETPLRLPLLTLLSLRPCTADGEWVDACVVRADAAGLAVEWLEPGMPAIFTLLAMGRLDPLRPAVTDWTDLAEAS